MAEFERGDIVVYVHPDAPTSGHGALAVIVRVDDKFVDVAWISPSSYLMDREDFTDALADANWEPRSFEKVGHLDGF